MSALYRFESENLRTIRTFDSLLIEKACRRCQPGVTRSITFCDASQKTSASLSRIGVKQSKRERRLQSQNSMAEAMLEDDFKSSHPDLVACEDESKNKRKQTTKQDVDDVDDEALRMIRKKSVDFSLLPSPKRTKPTDLWTAKQVVDGA